MSDYLETDWAAMTGTDWTGLIVLLLIATLMAAAYIITLRPGNRDSFEQYRDFVNDEEEMDKEREVENGHAK